MEPANVEEVFEEHISRPGVTVIRVHWDRLRSLDLPIDSMQEHPAAEFSSALRGDAWNWAIEVVLVWHKVLAPYFSLVPFGSYTLTSIDEDAEGVTLTVEQDVGAERPVRHIYRFARERSLTGVEIHLRDGSVLSVTEAR